MSLPHRPLTLVAITVVGLLALSGSVLANPGDLGLEFKTIVQGTNQPSLIVNNTRDIKKLDITLTDERGKKQVMKSGPMGKGSRKTLSFKQGEGTSSYKASLAVVWGDGESKTYSLDFQATRVGKLALDMKAEDVDLDERKLIARANNPATHIELVITGESGEVIWSGRERFDPPAQPGEELAIAWDAAPEKILTMQLKVHDVAGFWVGLKITPFSIDIPHETVVFDSGSSTIRADQSHKLEATWGLIQEALNKHGTLLQLKLFIAGYTDTVGDKASNRALSNSRAASIAAWFRKRGLRIPIYYAGYGEEVLSVKTPDETEEQQNRRAKYVLSSHTPSGPELPTNEWRPL